MGRSPFLLLLLLQPVKTPGILGETFALCRFGNIFARLDAGNVLKILRSLPFVRVIRKRRKRIRPALILAGATITAD
jgi:hypothetical protein